MSTHLNPQLHRTSSAASARAIVHENDLAPYSSAENARSRRASLDLTPVILPTGPVRPDPDQTRTGQKQPETDQSEQPGLEANPFEHGRMDSVEVEQHSVMYTPATKYQNPPTNSTRTVVYSGKSEKAFEFDSATLIAKSSYWKKLLASKVAQDPIQYRVACTFREPEEISMALFGKWLYGEKLNGPTDFHSTQHYLGLYVLARVWECESLENEAMDLIRNYYATEHITSSPYRLEYIYTYTPGPNPMRRFLISTAAFRALTESNPEGTSSTSEPVYLSAVMQNVLAANTTLAQDYLNALIHLHRTDMPDARHGSACAWHEHTSTKKCQERPKEVWEEQ